MATRKVYTYIDGTGKSRRMVQLDRVKGVVQWSSKEPMSYAHRYMVEDGTIIQVPDNAWEWSISRGTINSLVVTEESVK